MEHRKVRIQYSNTGSDNLNGYSQAGYALTSAKRAFTTPPTHTPIATHAEIMPQFIWADYVQYLTHILGV